MQLAERRFLDSKSVTEIAAPKVSGNNRQIYQRLKLALSLELRCQIFVAVCDDLPLRDRLVAKLQAELNYPSLSSHSCAYTSKHTPREVSPQLVSLRLNLRNPNPIAQISQWLAGHPQHKNTGPTPATASMPAFQLLGVEHLTRQPPAVQWSFLSHLREIDRTLLALESNLLLWVTEPWLRSIQESASEFWNWRTGVFEFDGEPTPAPCTDSQQGTQYQKSRPSDRPSDPRADAQPSNCKTEPSNYFAFTSPPASQTASVEIETQQVAAVTDVLVASPRPIGFKDNLSVTSITESAATFHVSDITLALFAQEATEFGDQPELDDAESQVIIATLQSLEDEAESQVINATLQSLEDEKDEEEEIFYRGEDEFAQSLIDNPQTDAPLSQRAIAAAYLLPESEQLTPTLSFEWLKAQSEELALLVDLVKAGAKHEVSWGAPLLNSQSIQTLQEIEELHQQSRSPVALAAAYRKLGDLWRDRVDRGDSSPETLTIAIRAYEQMLHVLDGFSNVEPDILNDLGNLYWMLSRHLSALEQKLPYLERGIETYEAALTTIDPHILPQTYAMIQNNLGAVYGDLARYRERAENLQKSVVAYEEALRYRRLELENSQIASPQQYAATLNNLGTAYWNLAQHQQPVTHLKQAIAAYNEAILYYSPERQPLDYAMIENNLGTAYWNLAQYEQPENYLLLAISAYQVALTYRTPQVLPGACAATQNNLGTAYWHLANHSKGQPKQRLDYLQQAIASYEVAVNIAQQLDNSNQPAKPLSFDIFSTHNNLGLAHYQIASESLTPMDKASRSRHLEIALHHHLQALYGWQQQPDFSYKSALSFVVQTIRAFYSEFGIQGQNLALSKVPGQLLPEILRLL